MTPEIRPEQPEDYATIRDVTQRAFAPMPFAGGNEQDLIDEMRTRSVLAHSLVATVGNRVVGHVALTKTTHESGTSGWYALGPISVVPELQRKGIGTALVRACQDWLEQQSAEGCILIGDINYYSRHGFLAAPLNCPLNEPAEHFMLWSMGRTAPTGRFGFDPVFYDSTD